MESKQAVEAGYCVSVTFVSGKDLTSRDIKGGGDPYCILSANGNSSKTQVFKGNGKNPVWNRRLDLISKKQENKIKIRVMDYDRTSKDDLIGETEIDVKDLWGKGDPYPPFQWVDIHTVDKKGKKKCEGSIQIQIECKKVDDAARLTFFNYTHLITAIVVKAEGLRSMDHLSSNDTHIELSWGVKTFRTACRSGKNPNFNEAALFCVDGEEASGYLLKVSAFDEDKTNKRDFIGEGYVLGKNIANGKLKYTDAEDKDNMLGWITLSETRITKDVNADDQIANHEAKNKSVGRVKLKISVKSREDLEDGVLNSIMADFDTGNKDGVDARDGALSKRDGDGELSKDEVASLVSQCAPDLGITFDSWFRSIDVNGDGKLSKEELKKYMSSTEFLSSNYVQNYIQGHELCAYAGNPDVMTDVSSGGSKRRLFVVHRVTNQVLEENIPGYISVALKGMFSSGVGRVFSRNTKKLMTRLSKRQGRLYDAPKSRESIQSFINLHDLNTAELVQSDPKQYKNFNDFFARAIKPEARPIADPEDPTVCVSPADCRMMVFENIVDAAKFWVKGSQFTVERLLGNEKLAKHFHGGSFAIARLSPQDYHRWHMPVTSTHGKVTPVPGALFTVNPIAINQPVNVYTENKRCVVELESESFGKVVMVAVGAAMVGSYRIFGEDGQKWLKGKVHGEFRFGGSTVLLLFEPGKIKFDDDLLRRSQGVLDRKPTETLLQVNTRIGVAIGSKHDLKK